jgi:hypothetical protein
MWSERIENKRTENVFEIPKYPVSKTFSFQKAASIILSII